MILTISGPPGSGKTTVASAISEEMGLHLILTGQIFRRMAEERGMSLSDFGEYASTHPEVDIELDRLVLERVREEIGRGNGVLVEGRLAGLMLHRSGLPAFRVYVTASMEVRAGRIRKREGGDMENIIRDMAEREECERKRYLSVYSYDIKDLSIYHLVVDSSEMPVEDVVERVLSAAREWADE